MISNFKVALYDINLTAGPEGLLLPPYKGSTLRGSFGAAFQQIICSQKERVCLKCMLKHTCPYSYIFETPVPPGAEVLKKYQSIPRPFVIEPPEDTRTHYKPGDALSFRLVLIGKGITYLPYFVVAFQRLGELGIGKGRKPFQLKNVNAVNPMTSEHWPVFNSIEGKLLENQSYTINGSQIVEYARKQYGQPSQIEIEFLTMTRLKYEHNFIKHAEFHIIIRNLLRRLSSLAYFHHGHELDVDIKQLLVKAEQVHIVEDNTRWVDWERFSSRQDRKINLGGIKGKITYEGEMSDFIPLLVLGELTHVGKGTVFGMGKYKLH